MIRANLAGAAGFDYTGETFGPFMGSYGSATVYTYPVIPTCGANVVTIKSHDTQTAGSYAWAVYDEDDAELATINISGGTFSDVAVTTNGAKLLTIKQKSGAYTGTAISVDAEITS